MALLSMFITSNHGISGKEKPRVDEASRVTNEVLSSRVCLQQSGCDDVHVCCGDISSAKIVHFELEAQNLLPRKLCDHKYTTRLKVYITIS